MTALRLLGIGLLVGGAASGTTGATDVNGFLREKGKGDVALSVTSESYDNFWIGETKVEDAGLGEVETTSASLWMAYGLTDELTLVATLPYIDADSDGAGGFDESGLQDIAALGLYRIAQGGLRVHHDFIGGLGLSTPASHYEANSPVDMGDGTTDWLLRLVYMLRVRGFYASQQVGYDIRGEDAPDGWPLYTELGYTVSRVTLTGFYQQLLADGGTDIGDPGFTFPSNEEEYERIGGKVFVRTGSRFGVAASFFDTLDGRNTGESSGVSLGVDLSF